jgi:signal peptidase I
MAPAYHDGERVLLRRGGYRTGDVIMFRAPAVLSVPAHDVDWLMKRVAAVAGDPVPANLTKRAGCATVPAGRLLVRSDAPDGLDSRQLGLIDHHDVIGVVSARRVAGHLAGQAG